MPKPPLIIKPGQQNLTSAQLEHVHQKQKLLVLSGKWREFLDAGPDAAPDTDVGIDIKTQGFDDAFVAAMWVGAKQVEEEQKNLMTQGTIKQDDDHLPLMVADVITKVIGVVTHHPSVTGTALFRAFMLSLQLGILSVKTETEEGT